MSSVNPKVIQELRSLQSPESPGFLAELIDLFLKEAGVHLERLGEAFKSQATKAFERTAHTLKGSSGNLGALEMSRLCAELEKIGRTSEWGRAGEFLKLLDDEFARVKTELELEKSRG